MSTKENLMAAFAGESQANRKYLAFAKKAESEGYKSAARMFRAAAEAETLHAHAHFNAVDGVGSTVDNLKAAVSGETFEFEQMYPPYLEEAKKEGHTKGIRSISYAMEAEKVHARLFDDVLSNLSKEDDNVYYLCPMCGYVEKNGTPESCPICNSKGSSFIKVE